jgi:hypothetical protein
MDLPLCSPSLAGMLAEEFQQIGVGDNVSLAAQVGYPAAKARL